MLDVMLISDDTLGLRRLAPRDLSAFQSYRSDPQVGAALGLAEMSDAQALDFLAGMETCPAFKPGAWWQIGVEADGLIGDIGLRLSHDGREVALVLTLARAAQGRSWGLRSARLAARLVWDTTEAQVIRAIPDAQNTRALSLLARSAFVEDPPLWQAGIPARQFILSRPNLP